MAAHCNLSHPPRPALGHMHQAADVGGSGGGGGGGGGSGCSIPRAPANSNACKKFAKNTNELLNQQPLPHSIAPAVPSRPQGLEGGRAAAALSCMTHPAPFRPPRPPAPPHGPPRPARLHALAPHLSAEIRRWREAGEQTQSERRRQRRRRRLQLLLHPPSKL